MPSFDLVEPHSFEDAFDLLGAEGEVVRPLGGGTALMLMMKARGVPARPASSACGISIKALTGGSRVGADVAPSCASARWTPLSDELERSAGGRQAHFAAVIVRHDADGSSNVRVRNVATIGGNLAHGDPHMDLPPVMDGARRQRSSSSAGAAGERTVPVEEIFAGYYETTVAQDELIVELLVPVRPGWRTSYTKVTTRSAHDWPALGIALSVALKGRVVEDIRLVLSAAVDRQLRLRAAEDLLRGTEIDDRLLDDVGAAAVREADIGSDSRGSARYKQHLLRVYLRRALEAIIGDRVSGDADASRKHRPGRSRRLEAREKVTGRADYVHHLRLPDMLHGKIFRSTMPHARITRVDTSAAEALDGVYRVVTIDDVRAVIPHPYYGPAFHDQPILADGKVRFAGEPVAVVLAADPKVAEEAAGLITADYEALPTIYDETDAMESDVFVHDELKPAATFPDLKYLKGRQGTNVALDYRLRCGDTEAGFARADRLFEHTFQTQQCMHTPMEPFVAVGDASDGRLVLHTASQNPSFVRIEIARLLGWPENRVRVKVPHLGGGFGGKLYIKLEALVTALTLLVERPVKIALTMEEQFFMVTRHPCTFTIKSGVMSDGRIIARSCKVVWNGGAYADIGPRVTQKAGLTAAGPYDIESVAVDSYAVYTNRPPAGALRGFGAPQTAWAYECHTDLIAKALAMDPVAFRRKNVLRNGCVHPSGTIVRDAEIEAVLDHLVMRMNWHAPFDKGRGRYRRGRGIAIGYKGITTPTTSVAIINLYGDGSCGLYIGTVDMGQGSDTVMAQIAAEVLNIDARSIRVIHPDTDVTPYDMGTLGSRSTFHMGDGRSPRRGRRQPQDRKSSPGSSGCPKDETCRCPSCCAKDTGCRPATSSAPRASSPATKNPMPTPGVPRRSRPSGASGRPGPTSRWTSRPVSLPSRVSSTSPTSASRSIPTWSARNCRAPGSCSSASR